MAELPEIVKLSSQMRDTLVGKTLKRVELLQEKCSNVPQDAWDHRIADAKITDVYHKGKWILTKLDNGENIVLSLGMGADVYYFEQESSVPEKFQIKVLFQDGTGYTARFWWFGKYLLFTDAELAEDSNTKDIAMDPFDGRFTFEYFSSLLRGKRMAVKTFLMNQRNVGGIGNMYMHDILFRAKVHPLRKCSELTEEEVHSLYDSIEGILNLSREKNAFEYERDFFGQTGGYGMSDFLVGYKENTPCPVCGEPIIQIKTGSTSTFICPKCQQM